VIERSVPGIPDHHDGEIVGVGFVPGKGSRLVDDDADCFLGRQMRGIAKDSLQSFFAKLLVTVIHHFDYAIRIQHQHVAGIKMNRLRVKLSVMGNTKRRTAAAQALHLPVAIQQQGPIVAAVAIHKPAILRSEQFDYFVSLKGKEIRLFLITSLFFISLSIFVCFTEETPSLQTAPSVR